MKKENWFKNIFVVGKRYNMSIQQKYVAVSKYITHNIATNDEIHKKAIVTMRNNTTLTIEIFVREGFRQSYIFSQTQDSCIRDIKSETFDDWKNKLDTLENTNNIKILIFGDTDET